MECRNDTCFNECRGELLMRARIRAEIAALTPLDALERDHIADTLAWIDSGAQLCRVAKPATPPRHLVSYCVVHDGSHVLLADHRNAQLWLPTGGHVDQDEHPRAAAERELQEELGLRAPHPVGAPWMLTVSTTVGLTAGHTDVSLWYAVRIARDQALVVDPAEFLEVRWFAFDAIPLGRCDPNLARFLRKLSAAAT
jgi:8-oxo-dGTP diphosphatase